MTKIAVGGHSLATDCYHSMAIGLKGFIEVRFITFCSNLLHFTIFEYLAQYRTFVTTARAVNLSLALFSQRQIYLLDALDSSDIFGNSSFKIRRKTDSVTGRSVVFAK